MLTVYKYPIPLDRLEQGPNGGARHTIHLESGARVVHVGWDPKTDDATPTLWIELNQDRSMQPVQFEIVGTGHSVPEDGMFVGTAVTPSGFVWHVYRIRA